MKFQQLSVRNEMRVLNWGHAVQILLALGVIIVAFVKIGTGNVRGRSDIWGLGVGCKSLVFTAYMICTERVERLQRWYSIKAVMILNCIEFVFWVALVVINGMGVNVCSGLGCTLSGITIALGVVLAILAVPIAYVSIRHFYHYKRNGSHPHEGHHLNAGKSLPMAHTNTTQTYAYKQ